MLITAEETTRHEKYLSRYEITLPGLVRCLEMLELQSYLSVSDMRSIPIPLTATSRSHTAEGRMQFISDLLCHFLGFVFTLCSMYEIALAAALNDGENLIAIYKSRNHSNK